MKLATAIAIVIVGAWNAACLSAAEPSVRNLNIRGLQVGGTTALVIEGDDLGKTPRLLLPFPAKQTLKPGGTDKQATFDVSLPADVIPGYHHLRVVTEGGISLPTIIAVDRLPQLAFAALVEQVPVALHGVVGGSNTVETSFQGKAGQKVIVDVESHRLGSKLRPIIHLISPKKLQLAWAWPSSTLLFGDARLEATLPEDGVYTVTLHDAEYAASAPSFFRLKIGQWSSVEQVFPPVVAKGQSPTLELLGRGESQRISIAPPKILGPLPLAWPKDGIWSGPRPFVMVSSQPEFVKQTVSEKLQDLPAVPLGVSGRLLTPYEEDRYRVAVAPNSKVRLEVFAERIGSPLDVALVVRNDKGDQLARAEDSPGTLDPALEYAVPDKVTSIVVGVIDASGRGGSRGVYRLTVDPQSPASRSYRLTTTMQRVALPVGGRSVLPIHIERRGYAGKFDLAPAAPGLRFDGLTIPDDADGTLLTVERGDANSDAVVTTFRGRDADGIEHAVVVKGHPLERLQPWLANEIALAPTIAKAADFQVDWINLPSDVGIVPGIKLTLPVKVLRSNPKTLVKLTLVTSQNVVLVNNQPDPAKTIRQEKPIELGDKAPTGDVVALIPLELPAPVYDVAIQAELQSPDKKITYATAFTPVKRLAVRQPLVVQLAGKPQIEAAVDPKKGGSVKIQGKVERREGLKGDVTLTVTGLPPGAKADALTLKADASDFAVNVTLPPNVTAGEIKGLKLGANAAPDPKQPAQRVKSKEVDLTLIVKVTK